MTTCDGVDVGAAGFLQVQDNDTPGRLIKRHLAINTAKANSR